MGVAAAASALAAPVPPDGPAATSKGLPTAAGPGMNSGGSMRRPKPSKVSALRLSPCTWLSCGTTSTSSAPPAVGGGGLRGPLFVLLLGELVLAELREGLPPVLHLDRCRASRCS